MSGEVCLIMTPKLEELYNKLQSKYPKECEASLVNKNVFLGWVELYQKDFNKTPDFIPDLKSLVPYIENLRKREGKSFLNKEIAQKSEANSILVQFIKDIETLAGYYEGGGRVLSDDVPNFPKELDDKLNDYFMGGKELSLDDYRKLWKVLEFKDGKVYARKSATTEDNNQDIVTQLIDQLKASGITVLGKADMEKYLTEKGKLDSVLNLQAIKENQEMQNIKAKAIADGTFMKAPNGKPTNLTERQWLQVRTKNFIKWFGDWENDSKHASKVVDENGEPKVMFRTDEVNKTVMGRGDGGSFFATDNLAVAGSYASKEAGLYKGFVSLKNPYIIKGESHGFFFEYKGKETTVQEAQSSLIEEGYDGVYFERTWDVGDRVNVGRDYWANNVAMFNPNQFKSATDNNGMFSTENDNIRMAIENTSKEHGVTIQTEALNITGNKFKNSLYRGQGYAPVIDADGNLHLHTNYDSLSKLRTLSFDSTIEGAEHYGNRSARHPYIIEIDEDFLDTVLPKGEYDRDRVNRGESFRYNEEFNEVRLSFKDELIIPKGKFNITQTNETLRLKDFNDIMSSIGRLQSLEERAEIEENNGASEITGRVHENDINSLGNALQNTLGTYKGYNVFTILYDALALQNSTPGSPIGPSKQYREFIDKGLIETEDLNGFTYYRPSKALIKHVTKKLGLREISETSEVSQPTFDQNPPAVYAPYSPSDGDYDLPFFMTPDGEVYGFVDEKGNIYLDETVISPEHPIHEYTHLWDIILAKKNPALWNRGKQLLKDKNLKLKGHEKSIWQEVEEDPNYGLKWDKTKARYEDYVASEVHARLTGKKGLQLLDEIAKQKGSKNIISKLKQWILDVYKELKATFSKWTPEELDKLTIKDFTYMTLRDFTSGMDLSNVPTILKETSDPNISKEQVKEARNTLYHIIQTSKFRIDQIQDKIKWNKATKKDIQDLNKYKVKLKEDTELLAGLDTGKSEVYINEYNTPMVRWGNKKEKPSLLAEQSSITTDNLVNETPKTAVQRKEVKEIDKPNSEAIESALNVDNDRNKKYHEAFSPRQIADFGEHLADVFSIKLDNIEWTKIHKLEKLLNDDSLTNREKEEVRETLNKFKDPVKGRQLIAQEYGIGNLVNDLIKYIEDNIKGSKEFETDKEVQLWTNAKEYFNEIFNEQVTLNIEEAEGIRIVDLEFKESEEDEIEEDNVDNDSEDATSQYTNKDASGWIYKVRYTDPASTLSKKVKRLFSGIEKKVLVIDKKGEGKYVKEKNSIGLNKCYSTSQVYATFLSYFSNNVKDPDSFMHICKTYDELVEALGEDEVNEWIADDEEDFKDSYPYGYPLFPALEEMKKQYPWVGEIQTKLESDFWKDSPNPTYGLLSSQLYAGLKLAFIPYDKLDKDANKLKHLNHDMAEQAMLEKLKTNYYNGITLTNTSIYNSDGSINIENLKTVSKHKYTFTDNDSYLEVPTTESSEEEKKEFYDAVNEYYNYIRSFGIDIDTNAITALIASKRIGKLLERLGYIQKVINDQIESGKKTADTFDYMVDVRHPNSGVSLWQDLFSEVGVITDDQYIQSFYDSATKKTKYSYSADNYIMKIFRGIEKGSQEERRKFIDEHFGKYEWFRNQKTREWRNYWLDYFYDIPDGDYTSAANELSLPPYKNVDNVETESSGRVAVRNYVKWSAEDIYDIQQSGYDQKKNWAFYLAPIFSDSPMSLMVRGPKFTMKELIEKHSENRWEGTDLLKIERRGAFVDLVRQELQRIKYETERQAAIKEGKILPIDNFDQGKGLEFCFLPELNNFKINGKTLMESIHEAQKENAIDTEIDDIIREYVKAILEPKFQEYFSRNMKDFDKLTESDKEDLRVRYYNMVYANASMIQLLTVDLAFYKNFIDFQKRFKEVYSGGTQLNTNSRYGKKTERVAILRDIVITSPSYSHIAAAVDKNQNLSREDKEHIKGIFKNVNVADAQAIRSLKSFRAVMDMLGEWTPECDKALENFKNNNWNKADFDTIMNVLKPFLYGVIDTPDGLGNHIPMPVQHKNSEVCALMMYDLITNGLNNSPVYKALSRFMDEVVDSDGEPIADMIQFESASKVCNQGVINLNFSPARTIDFIKSAIKGDNKYGIKIKPLYDENHKEIAINRSSLESYYDHLKESLDNLLDKKELSQEDYNNIIQSLCPTEDEIIDMLKDATTITDDNGRVVINNQRVKEIPFEYYSKVQPVPLHHEDAKVPHGSQERNLAVADITDDTVIELKGKGENTKKYKGQDIIDFYYQLLNENLLEDYFGIDGEGGLAGIFKSKKSFAEAIKDVVRGNPKYDRGFMEAMEIHDSDFTLSPNSPTMFSAIQSIVTAFFRNRITKQKINGATLVQAAGVGLDKDLRLKFDDNGKLVGMECYLPVTSKALFEPLITIDENGNKILDPKKLEEFGLTEAIGYRIPTENKSSMAPLIIKGFTPIQNGSMIVLPAEITALAGSDFDVDKMFLILSSFGIRNYSMEKAWEDYKKENNIKINILSDLPIEKMSDDEFFSYLKEIGFDEAFNKWFNKRTGEETVSGRPIRNKDKYLLKDKKTGEPKPEVFAIKYDFNKSPKENGKKARNNMILQITHQLLCSKAGTEAFLNPQGFKDVEDAANLMRILHAFTQGLEEVRGLIPGDTDNEKLMAISKLSSKELSKIAKKIKDSVAPVYPQTFAKLHAQNMAGVDQLGIYAIQASMSAKYQRAKINIKPHLQFSINGRTVARADVSMNGRTVKNTNQMVGAAADNGKNPNLTAMGSTNKTATVIGTLLREGLTHKEAALIVNSPYMNLSKKELAKALKGKLPASNNVTTDMLIRVFADPYGDNGIANGSDIVNVMALCYKVQCHHQSMEYINNVSRADSPNGGMKNSYAGCRVQRYKVDVLQAMMGQKSFAFEPIKETLSNDAVDMTGSEDEIREQLNNQKMGLLHGMYALGINSFDSLTKDFFFGSQKWFDDMIVKPILYNLPIDTSDNALISTVNSIYKAYVIYKLSDSKLFGDDDKYTMEEKRKYYTEKFPEDFRKMISTNEELRNLLGNIFTVKMGRIMLLDAGNMNKKQISVVRDRVGALRYSDNEEVRRLATDLLLYSYYDNGLQYSNTSISSAFSIDFLMSFDEYNKALKNMNTRGSDEDSKNFIYQFLSYNNIVPKTIPSELKNDLKWDKSTGDLLIMNNGEDTVKKMTDTVLSPNPNYGLQMYPYIMWMGQIYVFDKESTENANYNSLIYHRVPSYVNSKERPRFNSNLKVSDLESLYSITAKEEMREQNKDAHDEGLIQEAKNRQGLGKVEDKNMLYDYEGMENEPFNYMDIATQDYDMEGQDKSDLLDEEAFKKPGYLDTLGEFVEDLLEDGDIKTIDINPSDEELSDTKYSKEGNDTLDTQMCIS